MTEIAEARWAFLPGSRPGLRVVEITDGDATAPARASSDLAVVSVTYRRNLGAVVRAAADTLAPGGALVLSLANPIYDAPGLAHVRRFVTGSARRSRIRFAPPVSGARGVLRALEAAGLEEPRVFATIPSHERPKILLPLQHRTAMRSFLRKSAAQAPSALIGAAERLASRASACGVLDLLAPGFHATAVKPGGAAGAPPILLSSLLAAEAARVLGAERARDLHFVCIVGWRMDGTNLAALAYERGRGEPSFVAKAAGGTQAEEIAVRCRNLEILGEALAGDLRDSAPRLLRRSKVPGSSILLESALEGEPLRLPRDPSALEALVGRVSDWLVRFQRAAGPGLTVPDDETFDRAVLHPFEAYRARFRPGPVEAAFLEEMRGDAAALRGRPIPLFLAHGDFCPPNLLLHGGRIRVLDWEDPMRPALPAQDLVHFLACIGETRAGSPDYASYEDAFFSTSRRASIARGALLAYADALEVPRSMLRLCFAAFWLDYALEKAEKAGGHAWSLAVLERETCLNVERLARAGGDFILR
jgi:SAM-dependent methyltransferase